MVLRWCFLEVCKSTWLSVIIALCYNSNTYIVHHGCVYSVDNIYTLHLYIQMWFTGVYCTVCCLPWLTTWYQQVPAYILDNFMGMIRYQYVPTDDRPTLWLYNIQVHTGMPPIIITWTNIDISYTEHLSGCNSQVVTSYPGTRSASRHFLYRYETRIQGTWYLVLVLYYGIILL